MGECCFLISVVIRFVDLCIIPILWILFGRSTDTSLKVSTEVSSGLVDIP